MNKSDNDNEIIAEPKVKDKDRLIGKTIKDELPLEIGFNAKNNAITWHAFEEKIKNND